MCKIPEKFRIFFWDTDFDNLDLKDNSAYIISRLYNKGGFSGIKWVHDNFTDKEILNAIKTRRDFHPIVANYLRKKYHLSKNEMNYYKMKPNISWR